MSVNSFTHLSNTICYFEKPQASRAELAKTAAGEVGADGKNNKINGIDKANALGPNPTRNAGGQIIGGLVDERA